MSIIRCSCLCRCSCQPHDSPKSAEWDGGNKYSSVNETHNSPYYTPSWTYSTNHRGEPDNVLEFPGVPYEPMDFHSNKGVNSWNDPMILSTGWLSGLPDLDTSTDYVRQRICDYFGEPDDLAVIFA